MIFGSTILACAAPSRSAGDDVSSVARAETLASPPAPATGTAPTPAPTSTLATHTDLAAIGVQVYRTRYDTPGASMSFEVTVENSSNAGQFVQVECVVLRDEADMKDIATADASPDLIEKAARRNSSDKTDSTFLVLGREVNRAYLVFEFSNPGKPNQRYLLPVTSVPRHQA